MLRFMGKQSQTQLVSELKWMNQKPIIQSEVSQKEKQIWCLNVYMWTLGNGTDEPGCRVVLEMQT